MITTLAATLLCALLACLSVFQVLLAGGAPLGRLAWGGQHRVLPTRLRIGSAVSVGVYAVIAVVVSTRAGLLELGVSDALAKPAMWVVTGYFLLGIGMNLASRSRPERLLMSPVCAVLFTLSCPVALAQG